MKWRGDQRYRCGHLKAYWLCVEVGVRVGTLLYVFLEHFQMNVSWSGSWENQEMRKMQTLLCAALCPPVSWAPAASKQELCPPGSWAEPLAASKQELESCFLSASAVVWPGRSGLLALEVGSWVIFMSWVSSKKDCYWFFCARTFCWKDFRTQQSSSYRPNGSSPLWLRLDGTDIAVEAGNCERTRLKYLWLFIVELGIQC